MSHKAAVSVLATPIFLIVFSNVITVSPILGSLISVKNATKVCPPLPEIKIENNYLENT